MPDTPYLLAADGTPAAAPPPLSGDSAPPAMPAPAAMPAASVAPQPAPAPPAQPTAQQADYHQSALLGKTAQFLLGSTTQYQVDPQTGKMVATQVPNTPGSMFRSILAGALLGGAVGSQNHSGSGLQAAAQGAGAVVQQQGQQDAARKQAAVDDSNRERMVNKDEQARQLQAAQLAHLNVQNVAALHTIDLAERDHIDHLNQVNTALQKEYDAMPGVQHPPLIVGGQNLNGQPGNGIALMQAATKDPSIQTAPQGYQRFITPHVDYSGLEYDGKSGKWMNPDGTPADLNQHTTVTVTDVPDNIMNKQVKPGAKVLNTLIPGAGFKDADDPGLTLGQLTALTSQSLDRSRQDKQDRLKERVANSEIALHGAEASKEYAEAKKARQDAEESSDSAYIQGMISPIPTVDIYSDTTVRNNRREALIRAAQKADPNFDPVKYRNTVKLKASLEAGDDAKALQSFDTFLGHTDDLLHAVDNLRNTKSPIINRSFNWISKNEGNPAVSNTAAPILAAKEEFQKFLNNAALTDSDKAEGEKLIKDDMSPAQFEGNAKQFVQTALIRLGAINNKFRAASGQNWPNMLSDQGRARVNRMGMGPIASEELSESLPPQAASQVKDGQVTHFANGQAWTSTNGVPWRVQ